MRTHQPMPYAAHVEAFDLHGQYEERAAIIEYDGGLSRQEAEARAHIEVYAMAKVTHHMSEAINHERIIATACRLESK